MRSINIFASGMLVLCIASCTSVRDRERAILAYNAAAEGDQSTLEALIYLDRQLINKRIGITGLTLLMAAARNGSVDTVRLLIDYGVDINKQDLYGNTAVYHAAYTGNRAAVRIMCAEGSPDETTLAQGLCAAAEKCDVDLIRYLLEMGAPADGGIQCDLSKKAADHDCPEVLEVLQARETTGKGP